MPHLPKNIQPTPKPALTGGAIIGITFVSVLVFIVVFSYIMYTCVMRCIIANRIRSRYERKGMGMSAPVRAEEDHAKKDESEKGTKKPGSKTGGGEKRGEGRKPVSSKEDRTSKNNVTNARGALQGGGVSEARVDDAAAPETPLMGGLFD